MNNEGGTDAPGDQIRAETGDGPPDAGTLCPAPSLPAGIPDGGVRCSGGTTCDPGRPDGGVCYGVPTYAAATTSVEIWVEDAATPSGGARITLTTHGAAVTVGGHTYEDRGDGLLGTGAAGIAGDLVVARDGQPQWMRFHLEGFASYHGGGVWDWPARVTLTSADAAQPADVGRHYTITLSGPVCPAGGARFYTFTADDPPRACAFGVDLLSFVLPGA